jgi:hypothetical protein
MYSGEYDACDVTLSVYPHRASLKNIPDHGGNRNQAIMHALRDALLLYAKHIGHFALNPNSVATRARSQAIMQLRDAPLSYAKHIGNFVLKYKFRSDSCSVSSNHVWRDAPHSYVKHIGNFVVKCTFSNYACSVSSNHAIVR